MNTGNIMKAEITQEISVTFNKDEAQRIKDLLGEFIIGRERDSYSLAAEELATILANI